MIRSTDSDERRDRGVFLLGVVVVALGFLGILRLVDYFRERKRGDSEEDNIPLEESNENSCCYKNFLWFWLVGRRRKNVKGNSEEVQVTTISDKIDEEASQVPVIEPLPDLRGTEIALKFLQRQDQSGEKESGRAKLSRIRLTQNILQLDKSQRFNEATEGLVIGIDSTSKVVAGYCVDLHEMSIDYYVIKIIDTAWFGESIPEYVTIENILFALGVWNEKIKMRKQFRLYVNSQGDFAFIRSCKVVTSLLHHICNCEGATLMNWDEIGVCRKTNLVGFAQFIQPASDLSRWEITKAVDFLRRFYEIDQEKVNGTVKLMRHGPCGKPWYDPSERYQATIKTSILYFASTRQCKQCNLCCDGENTTVKSEQTLSVRITD